MKFLILLATILIVIGCDNRDRCLDAGGYWDQTTRSCSSDVCTFIAERLAKEEDRDKRIELEEWKKHSACRDRKE